MQEELKQIEQLLASTRASRCQIEQQRDLLAIQLQESQEIQDALLLQLNGLESEGKELADEMSALDDETDRYASNLDKYLQINSMNDAFHIWYAGPYGTINNFRLGSIAVKPIDSNEINAALGQTALLVYVLASKLGVEFKAYTIAPMGSFPRITKNDPRTSTAYPLHLDASGFTLYPKWNFNQAIIGFMCCIQELGEHTSETDPTLSMPYKISLPDSKIGEACFTYGSTDDEGWTRAMKFMLSNIKWLVAWATKHAQAPFPSY